MQNILTAIDVFSSSANIRELYDAKQLLSTYDPYQRLTAEQGRVVALAALELFDKECSFSSDHYIPHIVLTRLAASVSGALNGLYARLIKRDIFWADGIIYREADPANRDLLFTLLTPHLPSTANHMYSDLLSALAWIADEKVLSAFNAWRHAPPAWYVASNYLIQEHTKCAGWELTPDGQKRDLYHDTCYKLIASDEAEWINVPRPVNVIAPHKGRCGDCAGLLVTLFDFDLRDPRISFLGMQGERLRIAFCPSCMSEGIVTFTSVDVHGASRWRSEQAIDTSETIYANDHEGDESWGDLPVLPSQRLVLGNVQRTPYETVGMYWQDHLSQIGGHPEWVQYPEYPHCPGCQHSMTFVGQLAPKDILPNTEGLIYAFLCTDCNIAATGYQEA